MSVKISGVLHGSRGLVKARREMRTFGLRVLGAGERVKRVVSALRPARAFCLVVAIASNFEADGGSVCS